MKRITLILIFCLILSPVSLAESTHTDDFFSGLSQAWDGLLGMADDAGQAISTWADESSVTGALEDAGNSITTWANTALSDLQSLASDSGITEWAESISAEAQRFVQENRPAVEAWLKEASEEVKQAWDTLVNANRHTEQEIQAALEAVTEELKTMNSINYMALVNKLNPLPDGWEDALETVHVTNSVGDAVEAEKRAYEAYLALAADLETNDGVHTELDSGYRSIAEQQEIMDNFIETYGADYAAKTVATPGYSEHHTGLALDLYFIVDGKTVYKNEDLVQYPEIWDKIHVKLADYGFILRYLDGKEHITGYGYEPWHIRYIDDVQTARDIMSQPGMTLEVWLGAVKDTDPLIDYGHSALYSEAELEDAAVQIKCQFASFAGCELHSLRYAGDECTSEENIKWLNELDGGKNYTQVVEFLSDFHSPVNPGDGSAWEPDMEYTDYQWWLAREEGKGWQLLNWGY